MYKLQLHISALNNGHLQVVHEVLSKQLYYIYYVLYIVGGWEVRRHEISYVFGDGRCGYMGMLLFCIVSMLM